MLDRAEVAAVVAVIAASAAVVAAIEDDPSLLNDTAESSGASDQEQEAMDAAAQQQKPASSVGAKRKVSQEAAAVSDAVGHGENGDVNEITRAAHNADEEDDVDPWASEDETSDDYDEWHEAYANGYDDDEDDNDDDMDFDDYAERRRAREKENAAKAAAYYFKLATTPRDEQALVFDEQHRLYWVHDKVQNKEIVTSVAREWRILVDYLHAVKDRMSIEDPTRLDRHGAVQIGRDGEDDWWINVVITPEKPGSQEADDEAMYTGSTRNWDLLGMKQDRRYQMIHESIILQSMMAQVDYDAWLDAFLKVVAAPLPPFVHLYPEFPGAEKTRLPRRFSISFPPEWDVREYGWTPFMKMLFQPKKWSDGFEHAYCKTYQIMKSRNFDMDTLAPIPIKLRFAPQHCGYLKQIAFLKAMMHLIAKIKAIEERWHKRRQWRACPQLKAPPVLFVESLDLDLREFTIYPSVLNTVEKLVATAGVRIENLTLPGREFDGVYEENQLRSAWAALSCTVLGIKGFRHGSRARVSTLPGVDRLVVPSFYMEDELCVPFLMAARDAHGVQSVRIEVDVLQARRSDYDRCFGGLIGYAFFSEQSKSSITTLDLDQMVFSKQVMGAMERVVQADDPLQQVCREITHDRSAVLAVDGREISLKMGTLLTPRWSSPPTKTPAPWNATVIFDDPAKPSMTVYAPGFGLCDIDRWCVPNKKRRTMTTATRAASPTPLCLPSTGIRHLLLRLRHEDDTEDTADNFVFTATPIVFRLGNIVGSYLKSFQLASESTTVDTLGHVLSKFKALEHLSLIDAELDDLSALVVAYHEGSRISSLDLSGCQIPAVVFKSFMRWLTTDERVKRTLRRIRFGKKWEPSFFTSSTVDMISSMLKANKQLTHVHINIPEDNDMWKTVGAVQAQTLRRSSFPLRHQLAVLSVLTQQKPTNGSFDAVVVQHILSFVAPRKRRTVIVEAPPPPPIERNPLIRIMREMYGDDDPQVMRVLQQRRR